MGKIKKSRRTKVRQNVVADNSDEEEQVMVDTKENVVQTILDQIQTCDVLAVDGSFTPLSLANANWCKLKVLSAEDCKTVWKSKELHGRFYRALTGPDVDLPASVNWLCFGDLFGETEGFVCAISDEVIMTNNYRKYMKDGTVDVCRACYRPTANVEEKYCGLQTFAMLIETPENIEMVINKGMIKVVAPLLLDQASSVRNAAAGALRNLSAAGLEACEGLLEQDVMTTLICYFHEHTETFTPDSSSATKDEDMDTIIQCINLLWNLCESTDLAIKYLGQSRILDILPRYLDLATFGTDIVTAVLQCLIVVVEDNPQAMEKIKSNSERQLQALLSLEGNEPAVLLVKTLASGVTINTCGGNMTSLPANVIHQIMAILASTLSVDHRTACNQLSSEVPLPDGAGKITAPTGKAAQVLDNHIKSVTQMLEAQQSSVEIIANICFCEDADDSDSGQSSDNEDLPEDDITCNGDDTMLAEDKLPTEILEALISLEIFDKVWAKTQLPAENVLMILKEYDGSGLVCKKLQNLQTRSLLCVNNMLSSLPIDNLRGVNGVYKIWVEAGKLVFKQNSDAVLLESATAVMRASLDKIKLRENGNTDNVLFSDLAVSDLEMMLTGIQECNVPEIRSNLIRMIGLLALLLVNTSSGASANVICTITDFILDQAHKENEVWVLAEAVDTIIDLYSEDETDALAAKLNLVEKLTALSPILKNKARQQKKLPREYKVLVSTVTSNLPRFIKYKKGRISKL